MKIGEEKELLLSPRVRYAGKEVVIDGISYPRIPYGEGMMEKAEGGKMASRCHDCGVIIGKLHCIPRGGAKLLGAVLVQALSSRRLYVETTNMCDLEECPKCHTQAMSCACWVGRKKTFTRTRARGGWATS